MADYSKFFKRDNFLASVKAAKKRKQKWKKKFNRNGRSSIKSLTQIRQQQEMRA